MPTTWYSAADQTIYIPAGKAPKNDTAWEQTLSEEAAFALDKWLEQRETMAMYDGRDEIWLNREGNPYTSGSLNNLHRNLMDEAGVNPRGRNLVWYSFRHSIGTYVYEEYKSLTPVAQALRQKSEAAAARYVHPTHELKKDIAELM
jgi:site-specific recombinase XerD